MRILLLLLLLLLYGPVPAAVAAVATPLELLNRTLRAEFELARKPKIYVVVDLDRQITQIKAGGVVLRDLPIRSFSRWGRPSPKTDRTLVEKHALFEPRRAVIDPEAKKNREEGAKLEIKTLELDDMPAGFALSFDDGTRITVRGRAKTLVGRMGQLLETGAWHLSRPLIFNWKFLRGQPYTELRLTLSRNDARRLYWSLSEGVPCLIVWPQEKT